jgi:predicted alpha-1,6-mannanase (GH76 family)
MLVRIPALREIKIKFSSLFTYWVQQPMANCRVSTNTRNSNVTSKDKTKETIKTKKNESV